MSNSAAREMSLAEEVEVLRKRLDILHRADLILDRSKDMGLLLQQFLDLIMEAAQVDSGTLYLVDTELEELVFAVVRGPTGVILALQGQRMPLGQGIAGKCAVRGTPIWVPEVEHSRDWARELAERSGYRPNNVLCLPLKAQDRVIGVVQLFDHSIAHPYTQADLDVLSALVNDLALKMENARLLDSTREMVDRLRALLDVGLELGATLDRDRLLSLILDRARRLLNAETASIFELDDETRELILRATTKIPAGEWKEIRIPPGEGIAGWVAQHGETVLVPDVREDPRWYSQVDQVTSFVTHSILCAPLVVQEQVPGQEVLFRPRIIGVAQALNKEGGNLFTLKDVEVFEGLARQAALAMERTRLHLENARLLERTQEMVDRLRALLDVGLKLGATLDRTELLSLILEWARRLVLAEATSIFELDEETGELLLGDTTRPPPGDQKEVRVPSGQGISGWVAQHGEAVLVPDVRKDPRWHPEVDEITAFVTRSILCTPLVIQEQTPGQEEISRLRVVGVAQALNKEGDEPFTSADVEIFEGLARQAALAIERERLFREMNAFFISTLTSLANTMEAKDAYTRGHTRRVTTLSVVIAEQMGLLAEEVGEVRYAAMLHDIGKIGMPEDILRKDGRVSEAERDVIRQHPGQGEHILKPFYQLRPSYHLREVIRGVAEHHERYDGTGYPQRLRGEEISLAGRIIAVADTFDAMTSDRPYRKRLPAETALEEIRREAGQQFDPNVVNAFLRAWERGLIVFPKVEPGLDQGPIPPAGI